MKLGHPFPFVQDRFIDESFARDDNKVARKTHDACDAYVGTREAKLSFYKSCH